MNGWAEILHRLGDPANGVKPKLFIHERCARLVECLPSLQHDPKRPEDVPKVDADEDGIGGDDTAGAALFGRDEVADDRETEVARVVNTGVYEGICAG